MREWRRGSQAVVSVFISGGRNAGRHVTRARRPLEQSGESVEESSLYQIRSMRPVYREFARRLSAPVGWDNIPGLS
jgi:hypothetical protein